MPYRGRKACNQRPQSLMSRRGAGRGRKHRLKRGLSDMGASNLTRVKRTRREGHWERKIDRREGDREEKRSLCCSLVSGGQTEAGRGAGQRALELES